MSSPATTSILHPPRAVWAVAFACVIAFMGIGAVRRSVVSPAPFPMSWDLGFD